MYLAEANRGKYFWNFQNAEKLFCLAISPDIFFSGS